MGEPPSPRRRDKTADDSGKPGAGTLLRSTATKRWFKSRNAQVRFTELTGTQEAYLKEIYSAIDADGDGTLDTAELAKVLKMYTEMDLGGKSTASRYAIAKLFASMDQDGSGEVDFHEFAEAMCDAGSAPAEVDATSTSSIDNPLPAFEVVVRTHCIRKLVDSSWFTDANKACNEAECSVERFCRHRSFLEKHSKEDPRASRCNSPTSRSSSRAQSHPNPSRTQSRMSHSSHRPAGEAAAYAPPRTKGAAIIRNAAPDPRSYVMRKIAPPPPPSSRAGERSQSRSSVQTLGYAASRTTSRRTSYME